MWDRLLERKQINELVSTSVESQKSNDLWS
jgi:hypothetical protein